MGKRLWDLAKSRIEIGTILPGHRHKVVQHRVTVSVTDESVRVTDSSCPAPFSHIHKLTLASLKQALNPESSYFRLGRCPVSYTHLTLPTKRIV